MYPFSNPLILRRVVGVQEPIPTVVQYPIAANFATILNNNFLNNNYNKAVNISEQTVEPSTISIILFYFFKKNHLSLLVEAISFLHITKPNTPQELTRSQFIGAGTPQRLFVFKPFKHNCFIICVLSGPITQPR